MGWCTREIQTVTQNFGMVSLPVMFRCVRMLVVVFTWTSLCLLLLERMGMPRWPSCPNSGVLFSLALMVTVSLSWEAVQVQVLLAEQSRSYCRRPPARHHRPVQLPGPGWSSRTREGFHQESHHHPSIQTSLISAVHQYYCNIVYSF